MDNPWQYPVNSVAKRVFDMLCSELSRDVLAKVVIKIDGDSSLSISSVGDSILPINFAVQPDGSCDLHFHFWNPETPFPEVEHLKFKEAWAAIEPLLHEIRLRVERADAKKRPLKMP